MSTATIEKARRYTVTIRECTSDHRTFTTRVLVQPDAEEVVNEEGTEKGWELAAIARAVEKRFGRRAFWHPDHGLPGFGQVFEGSSREASARTPRARLDLEKGWHR